MVRGIQRKGEQDAPRTCAHRLLGLQPTGGGLFTMSSSKGRVSPCIDRGPCPSVVAVMAHARPSLRTCVAAAAHGSGTSPCSSHSRRSAAAPARRRITGSVSRQEAQWAAWWSAAAARSTEPEGQPCGCEAGIGERRFNALQQCSKPPRLPHYRTIVSPVTRRGEAQPRADVQTGYSVEAAAMRKRRDTHPELDRARTTSDNKTGDLGPGMGRHSLVVLVRRSVVIRGGLRTCANSAADAPMFNQHRQLGLLMLFVNTLAVRGMAKVSLRRLVQREASGTFGNHVKIRQGQQLTQHQEALLQRVRDFLAGRWTALLAAARDAADQLGPAPTAHSDDDDAASLRRWGAACAHVRRGEVSRGFAVLRVRDRCHPLPAYPARRASTTKQKQIAKKKVLPDDAEASELFAHAANLLASAQVPTPAVSRLAALRKPAGGMRGIATGDTFRRLVSRCLARQYADTFDQATRPCQFALQTRAGTDASSGMLRAAIDLDADATIVSLDGRNAYDTISRAAFLWLQTK
ncbi:hypothetical protein AK812_SmicGene36908 [Symbiodinium microadriaticum]|uniref:Reverse transcriptase domain-containing protein n=1 Tax=Symbiodinium microadriaticum TaxID=2951 RepID=A0A1Q9CHM7_SYMMI|nr:hypothetical protein AK812_SmicGene36908 [Symbiodinium microadriaticum]